MTMFRDYSSLIAQDVDEDTDDLEPMDPNIFFGADDDDADGMDDDDMDEDDDEPLDDEFDGEY